MRAHRTRFAAFALLGLGVLPLAACGEEGSPSGADPGGTGAPMSAHEHPTDAETAVLRIVTAGGYTSMDYQFAIRPTVVVYGDGRVLATDPEAGDTRLRTLHEGTLDEAGLQSLLASAADAGLLAAPPSYEFADGFMVTDNPTTSVEIAADGDGWTHEAYALTFTDGDTPARQRLRQFVADTVAALDEVADADYEPERLRLLVSPVSADDAGDAPRIDWPAEGPELAGAGGCRVVDAAGLVEPLSGAGQGTFVRQGDRLYAVTAAAVLPGEQRPCADW